VTTATLRTRCWPDPSALQRAGATDLGLRGWERPGRHMTPMGEPDGIVRKPDRVRADPGLARTARPDGWAWMIRRDRRADVLANRARSNGNVGVGDRQGPPHRSGSLGWPLTCAGRVDRQRWSGTDDRGVSSGNPACRCKGLRRGVPDRRRLVMARSAQPFELASDAIRSATPRPAGGPSVPIRCVGYPSNPFAVCLVDNPPTFMPFAARAMDARRASHFTRTAIPTHQARPPQSLGALSQRGTSP
jgi:hypothetical protein